MTTLDTLGVPSKRQDALQVMEWIDSMLMQIQSQEDTINEYDGVEMVYLIYKKAWQEIIRQVSVNCVERGYAMQKIFDAFLHILKRQVEITRQKKQKYKQKYEEQTSKLNLLHKSVLDKLQKDLDHYKEKSEKMESELEQEKQQNSEIMGFLGKMKKKVAKLTMDNDQA